MFSALRDVFGIAYSYCGTGNAYRMLGKYEKASASFGRASALYQKIGDRVSYSYTLWSIGTTHKMLGDFEKARHYFKAARSLFQKTKDPRGLIYCRLGMGEVAMLEGRKARAEEYFEESLKQAAAFGFKVEYCHAEMLRSYLSGKIKNGCYNRLLLKLAFDRAPFNIP